MATSFLKPLRAAVAVLSAVVMTMLFVAVPGAEAAHVQPSVEDGTEGKTCATYYDGAAGQYKLEDGQVSDGEKGNDEFEVTIDVRDDGRVIDFSDADPSVVAVFVKGGGDGYYYEYDDGGVTSHTGLRAPDNDGGQQPAISFISFCYDIEDGQDQPADIGLTVDKTNDANGNGTFTKSETAPAEDADVPFRVEITNPKTSEANVELSSAGDTWNGGEANLFDKCDDLSDDTVLEPGESVTCTFTITDYAPPAGESLDNTVTVDGHEVGDTDNTTSANDDSTVTTKAEGGANVINLMVDKVNNADGDDDFTDDETAPAEGADVPFSVEISNPADSDAAVVLDSATDAFGDTEVDLFDECDNLSDGTVLEPGDSVTCTFTLADYAPAAGESLDNVVTVEGHEQDNPDNTTSADDGSTVDTRLDEGEAAINLVVDKVNDADGDGFFFDSETAPSEGAPVEFRVTVSVMDSAEEPVDLSSATDTYPTNDGDTANDTTVDLFDECDDLSDSTVLEPGDSVTCTFTLADYAPAAGESLDNLVTVEGHEVDNPDNPADAEDDSTVTTASQEGPAAISLTVDKVNNADGDDDFTDDETAPTEGADVPFSVEISNPAASEASVVLDSATDTFGDTEVDLFDECDNLSDGTVLEPGDSVTCTFTLADYAPAAGESLDNVVTVEGHEQDNPDNTTSAEDDSTVDTEEEEVLGETDERDEPTEAAQQPGIAVEKVALVSPGAAGTMTVTYVPDDGDEETVTYRYRITNTGDTTLDQVQLTDDVLGTVDLDDTSLEPGESTTATAIHVLTEADAEAGRILNVATATGTAPDGEQVSALDDALVLVEAVQPAVEAADEQLDQAPAEDQLPATGADAISWSALAIGLLVVGAAALVATRQRATA